MKNNFVPLGFVLTLKNLTTRIPVFVILNKSDDLNSEKKAKPQTRWLQTRWLQTPIVGNLRKNNYLPMSSYDKFRFTFFISFTWIHTTFSNKTVYMFCFDGWDWRGALISTQKLSWDYS